MSAPTVLISPYLVKDLVETLARLRMARAMGEECEAKISERRLNWLIDTKLAKPDEPPRPARTRHPRRYW